MDVWGREPDEIDQWIRGKWFSIRQRCDEPTAQYYKDYGGRGIKLSEEFHNPLVFIDYMRGVGNVKDAYKQRLEIDRIDNDKGYERGNLRWATRHEQAYNRRNTKRVVYNGELMLFKDFVAKYCSVGFSRARNLFNSGATLEEIVKRVGRGPRGPYRKRARTGI